MGVLFAADLSEDVKGVPLLFTPSTDVSRRYNVYESYLGAHPENTYWTDWGGSYDNPITNQVEMYIGGQYLTKVNSLNDCCDTPNSIYDGPTAGMIYINVGKHTWLYDDAKVDYRKTVTFLSGPKNPANPSDDLFNNEHWKTKLEVPKITVKLSDVINGLTKYSTFDFTLFNNDGYFDDLEASNFFNAPSYIRKTWKDNPTADDFIPIRYGMVETIKINDKTMTVSCADVFRTLEEPVSKVVKDMFPVAVKNQEEELPIVYGNGKVPLIEINDNQYVLGEYVYNVGAVYDKDGNEISNYSFSNGILFCDDENAETALAYGNTNTKLGDIIVDIITTKTKITFVDSFWDLNETQGYINYSPNLSIVIKGGTVREAVKKVLMSDMVFLIQKNDGRFTLRKWGSTYNSFEIENWRITQFPSKDYADAQKGYFSSCIIHYGYNDADDKFEKTFLFTDNEAAAEIAYNKLTRKEFETYLDSEWDAYMLAIALSNRFSTLRETIHIGVGYDTSEINLLDNIRLKLNINNRIFSKYNNWIVKEIDPAQDTLALEPASYQYPDEPEEPEPPPTPPPNLDLYISYTYFADGTQRIIPVKEGGDSLLAIDPLNDPNYPNDVFYFHAAIINDTTLNVVLYKGYTGSANFILTNEDFPFELPLTLVEDNVYFGTVTLFNYNND